MESRVRASKSRFRGTKFCISCLVSLDSLRPSFSLNQQPKYGGILCSLASYLPPPTYLSTVVVGNSNARSYVTPAVPRNHPLSSPRSCFSPFVCYLMSENAEVRSRELFLLLIDGRPAVIELSFSFHLLIIHLSLIYFTEQAQLQTHQQQR